MKPVIALVGRPNVGKSTLFNQLTRSRAALVADQPGLTRDRQYGEGRSGDYQFIVIDTGGIGEDDLGIDAKMTEQSLQAIQEANVVLFLVDGRAGLVAADEWIATELRNHQVDVHLVVNKTDGLDESVAMADFYQLGFESVFPIAASHGRGVQTMISQVLHKAQQVYPELQIEPPEEEEDPGEQKGPVKVAMVGRPNVGKSTLVNRMLGEDRVVVYDMPGTTRDSIYIPFRRRDKEYILIDTAGVRRRGKVSETVEKFSVIKSLQAIEDANVVVMLIDATEGVVEQDMHLLGFVQETGRSLVLAVNKWDGLEQDHRQRVKETLKRKLQFVDYAEWFFISALHGTGVGDLYGAIDRAWKSAQRRLGTSELTRILEQAVSEHQPPMVNRRRVKLRYAHMGGSNPPTVVIHGNQTDKLPNSYRRYLEKRFREQLKLVGTPVRLEFKTGDNPYAGRKNTLTPRQQHKRSRMMRHLKKRGK